LIRGTREGKGGEGKERSFCKWHKERKEGHGVVERKGGGGKPRKRVKTTSKEERKKRTWLPFI